MIDSVRRSNEALYTDSQWKEADSQACIVTPNIACWNQETCGDKETCHRENQS